MKKHTCLSISYFAANELLIYDCEIEGHQNIPATRGLRNGSVLPYLSLGIDTNSVVFRESVRKNAIYKK